MMIEQGIDQYKIDYANAEPGEKGRMAGDLAGQVLLSAFGAAETAEGIKDFVKSGKFANALKNISEVKNKLRSVIKASANDLGSVIKKVYSRENGLIDVEFAGVGRVVIKESEIVDDADEICKDRYMKWIEGALSEGVSNSRLTEPSMPKGGELTEEEIAMLTSNPDYLIEGEPFDCYAPESNNPKTVTKEISKKIKIRQKELH